jgi:hypothetical protein
MELTWRLSIITGSLHSHRDSWGLKSKIYERKYLLCIANMLLPTYLFYSLCLKTLKLFDTQRPHHVCYGHTCNSTLAIAIIVDPSKSQSELPSTFSHPVHTSLVSKMAEVDQFDSAL